MNIQSQISEELWRSINNSYNSGNFSNAIKDAFLYLTDIIRTKSGIESGDGEALIGEAFGKKDPLIKINKYETDSEKSEQDGLQFLLRGLYKFIRNPRNHEKIIDSEDNANRIILFLDLIITRISESKDAFDLEEFINLIFDSDFDFNEKYMDLLLNDLPEKYKFDALIEIYRKSKESQSKNSNEFLRFFITRLKTNEKEKFVTICSKDLLTTKNSNIIRLIIFVMEPSMWVGVEQKAKYRIENILIDCIEVGAYDILQGKTYGKTKAGYPSSLGTWAMGIWKYFDEMKSLEYTIYSKFSRIDENIDEVYFLLKWFSEYFFDELSCAYLIKILIERVTKGDEFVKNIIMKYKDELTEDLQKDLELALEKFNEIIVVEKNNDDEIPF